VSEFISLNVSCSLTSEGSAKARKISKEKAILIEISSKLKGSNHRAELVPSALSPLLSGQN
jgi:hypothetical protein